MGSSEQEAIQILQVHAIIPANPSVFAHRAKAVRLIPNFALQHFAVHIPVALDLVPSNFHVRLQWTRNRLKALSFVLLYGLFL